MHKKPLLICDWDCTLAEPTSRSFYGEHHVKTKEAVANTYDISPEEVERIYTELDRQGVRIEKLFSSQSTVSQFNLSAGKIGQFGQLKESLNQINPDDWFEPNPELVTALRELRPYLSIIVLSNSPLGLIKKIGERIGFDMQADFDGFHTMTSKDGAPKFVNAKGAFHTITQNHASVLPQSWSIGDSPKIDLDPASELGMNTALVDNLDRTPGDKTPYTLKGHTLPILRHIKRTFKPQ